MWGINTKPEYSDDEFHAELTRWAETAELCIPQVQQAINEVADWSSFPDMVSPPTVLVAQNFEIEVTVHPDSTDAAMWEALHGLQSLTGSLPTLVDGDDEPTPIELFIFSSRRGLGIHVEDHWPPMELQAQEAIAALQREPAFLGTKLNSETRNIGVYLRDDHEETQALSDALRRLSGFAYRFFRYGIETYWVDMDRFTN